MKKRIGLLAVASLMAFGMVSCSTGGNSSVTSVSAPSSEVSSSVAPSSTVSSSTPASSTPSSSTPEVTHVLVISVSGTKKVGETITFVAKLDGSPITDQENVTYTASDASAMTITKNKAVLLKSGDITVTAVYTVDGKEVTANTVFTIEESGLSKIGTITFPTGYDNTKSNVVVYSNVSYAGIITAVTTTGAVLSDNTGSIFVFGAGAAARKVGDFVTVTADVVSYFQTLEISGKNTKMSITDGTGIKPTIPEPVTLTDTMTKAWPTVSTISPAETQPFKFTGIAKKEGNYTYFTIGTDTVKLEPSHSTVTLVENVSYDVTGFTAGYNSQYQYNSFYLSTAVGSYDPVTSVTITAPSGVTSVNVGSPLALSVAVAPSTANPYVNWSSSDATIAVVDNSGVVSGLKVADSVVITATSVADSTKSASITLAVTNNVLNYTSVAKYDFSTIPAVTGTASGAIAASDVLALFNGTNPSYLTSGTNSITACTNAAKTYQANTEQGPKKQGLKMGTGSDHGIVSLTSSKPFSKAVLSIYNWSSSKLAVMTVNDNTNTLTNSTAAKDYAFTFTANTTITIDSSMYMVLVGVEFFEIAA